MILSLMIYCRAFGEGEPFVERKVNSTTFEITIMRSVKDERDAEEKTIDTDGFLRGWRIFEFEVSQHKFTAIISQER